jgi:hypothetical protein
MKKFKGGETSNEDKPRSGRPSTATTDMNHRRVDKLIRSERRATLRELATHLDCVHNAVKKWVYNSAHLNFFKEGSRVGFNDDANACDGDYVE